MSTDQTIQVDSSCEVLRALSSGKDCESLVGSDSLGRPFELRVLHRKKGDEAAIDRVRQQLSLIQLANHPAIRTATQPITDLESPSFALELPQHVHPFNDRFDRAVDSLQAEDRIEIAMQLIDAMAAAHRVGLCHGSLAAPTILISRFKGPLRVFVDFSATSFADGIEVADLSVENDLALFQAFMRRLLLPVIESSQEVAAIELLGGRQRAILRQWLNPSDQIPPTIGQWQTLLKPLSDQSSDSSLDQTGVVDPQHLEIDNDSTSNIESTSTGSANARTTVPDSLGRFRIEEKIGQGGMGAVYRAIDTSNGQTVALKVLTSKGQDVAQSIRRFRKEARLLADAQNEHVTELIDVGEDQGFHYLAMEYIDGVDLKQWLAGRGALPETEALQIIADLARALVEAHSREVVHRDIKPENVLLKLRDDVDRESTTRLQRPIKDFTVKLTDFGIARHVSQSESMDVTRAGAILGTPKYMSPEQCKSADDIGPAADVYSLGITMYQLLTGNVPFESDDYMKLAAMHCFDTPPSVQKRVAEISDMTARIVDRALSKSPADRYGDAGQMLVELLRTLRGESAAIEAHPRSPQHDVGKLWEKTVSWNLVSDPIELWPLVSNTERLNEAIGLPAVKYRTEKDSHLGIRKFGSFTLSGVKVSWEEHPFEWIEGQRMGILREFDAGPFKWFMSVVTLDAKPGGGTQLSHQVRIEPRNLIGRALTKIEADWKGFKNLKCVYQRMDRSIQSRRGQSTADVMDPFADVKTLTKQSRIRIDERLERIMEKGATNEAAEGLRQVLQHWASQELSHLRPLDIADRMNIDGVDMTDACLLAAKEGLLNLCWDILCPACRVTAATTNLLSDIDAHTHCEACDVDFKSNLGDAIEMVFRAHPEIREINEGQYCIGGPEHSPHVVAQIRLEPSECLDLSLNLAAGDYLLRGPRLSQSSRIRVQANAAPSTVDFTLSGLGGSYTPKLRIGQQTITLLNDLDTLHVVRIERTIPRDDVVTATMATANPTFRRLFPDQNFAVDTPIETETISFLATAIVNVESLYQSLGEAEAYALILGHHRILSEAVKSSGGTVVKTIGERMLAAFPKREQAVESAMCLRLALLEAGEKTIEMGIGVHCGPTLVATQNSQLDYFGGTVRAVSELPEFAGADTLVTEAVYSDSAVRERYFQNLQAQDQVETISLPGSPTTRCKRIETKPGELA
ncbi:MAG: protein kinase [Rubripirellula sp.]